MVSSPESMRNVAFVGTNHGGKTTLVESLLYVTGQIPRRGRVLDGTTTTDYEPEAIAKQISTSTSFAHLNYKNTLINILDCPGFVDFTEEVKLSLLGADIAVFVVEPDKEKLLQIDSLLSYTEQLGIARLVFINKLDKHDLNLNEIMEALTSLRDSKEQKPFAPLLYPVMSANGITGYSDLLTNETFSFNKDGTITKSEPPESLLQELETDREKLVENLADCDDELLERILDGKELSRDLLEKDLKASIKQGHLVPILGGSAQAELGLRQLLDEIVSVFPDPSSRIYKTPEGKAIESKTDGPFIGQVIKTYVHPQSGKLSLTKVISGSLTADMHLAATNRHDPKDRVGGIYSLFGKKQETHGLAHPGEIVAIARLEHIHTGDTISDAQLPIVLEKPMEPPPLYSLAISPLHQSDEAKLSTLLHKITEEDPIVKVDRDPDTHEYCLYGQGDVHLTLTKQKLERKYHIELHSEKPQIAYKETIQTKVEAHYKHKKQSGGRGQYGEVYLRIEPLERGSGTKFTESIIGGAVPRQYIPGVEKGVIEALSKGPLAGFPVIDISVDLFDGSFHEVDSDEISFKMAAIGAIKDGLAKAHPQILEPIAMVEISIPNSFTAGVLGQITGRRGHILGYGALETHPNWDQVQAHIPQAELWNYIIELRSLSHGLGYYTWKFDHMAPVPPSLSQTLIAQAQQAHSESHNGGHGH
jgi:elongation factor G